MCCLLCLVCCVVFFFKQKTAYEMRISDWSSDVCSSDLAIDEVISVSEDAIGSPPPGMQGIWGDITTGMIRISERRRALVIRPEYFVEAVEGRSADLNQRSEEHTSELQSLMRISYAVFCLKKKTYKSMTTQTNANT